MSAEALFPVANLFALAGWIVLVIAIVLNRPWLRDRVAGVYWPLALSLGYGLAVAVGMSQAEGSFSSLTDVRSLFANDWALLAGWVHYLAFDLFVGAWIAAEIERLKLSRLLLIPILPFTFLFGPVGFLLFHSFRYVYRGEHA